MTSSSWLLWAVLSAIFAAATAIFAKVGVAGLNSDLATLIRTAVVICVLVALVSATGQWQPLQEISTRTWCCFLARHAARPRCPRIERPDEPLHPPCGAERGIVRLDGQPGLMQAHGHGVEHGVAVAGEAQGREIVGLAGTHDQALAAVVDPVAQAAVAIGRGLGQAQHVAAEAVPAFRALDVENQVAKGEAGRH